MGVPKVESGDKDYEGRKTEDREDRMQEAMNGRPMEWNRMDNPQSDGVCQTNNGPADRLEWLIVGILEKYRKVYEWMSHTPGAIEGNRLLSGIDDANGMKLADKNHRKECMCANVNLCGVHLCLFALSPSYSDLSCANGDGGKTG